MHPIVLRGDEAQVEARFSPFGDSVDLDARYVHGLRRTYHLLRKLFWTHPMEPLGDMGHAKSYFGPFGNGVSDSAR
jgi:hypothetical protein